MFLNEYIDENFITKTPEHFNFAFDVVDRFAIEEPEKIALVWCDDHNSEKILTFSELAKQVNKTANVLKSLGIKKGDAVMLMLRRRYEFWYMLLALHKIGAIAVPATVQLLPSDITYRIEKAKIKMVVALNDENVISHIEESIYELKEKYLDNKKVPQVMLVNGKKDYWINFENLFENASSDFTEKPCSENEDICILYFTSGTSGYPKMVSHNYFYPLGHIVTAKCWQNVKENGLHLSLAETGWAKALWGKFYGQWMCECATFVYDFERFHASDILPMFKKYNITTFCAPPTMLRMMVKEDISKYDLSSVKHMTTAGEALNPEVYRQFEKATGLQILEGFGQSESTMLIGNLTGASHKIGSMGKPAPIYDIDVVDADGKSVPVGESGEIVVRVADGVPCGLFKGYYGDPEKTAEVWHDGYYHTGDTAWRDEDGFYWYVGRVDDVIKSSGYRIGPFEIESVIMELPYVLECGVSAVPDEVRGQVVKASIVLVKGTEATDELKKEIQEYVKSHTAP